MEKMETNVPTHFRFAASDLVLQLVIKLRRPNLDALLLFLQLLDHLGRSHRLETTARTGHRQSSSSSQSIPAGVTVRSEMTARTGHRQSSSSSSSELHCKSCNAQSLCPLVHFISLSLRPFLAPCACSMSALLQFSSELHCQSCNAQSPPLPSKTLRGTPSLFAVSV